DIELQPGGFNLHPVTDAPGRWFDPFTIDGIGSLPIGQTPTGAFSYGGSAYVFALWVNPHDPTPQGWPGPAPTTVLASKRDPGQAGKFDFEFTVSTFRDGAGAKFWQVAPVVVNNAEHRGLPATDGQGVVLLGGGW